MTRRPLVLLPLLALAQCTPMPDIQIRHPMSAGALDPNRIVRPHGFIEAQRALPSGAVSDSAELLSVDSERLCIGLSVHELAPIDLRTATFEMSAPKLEPAVDATVWPEPPTQVTYQGRVPETRQVGTRTVCLTMIRGVCVAWGTQPVYSTVYVPGPVTVYNSVGRVCFPNRGVVTAATPQVTVNVRLPKGELWGGSKGARFTWGFHTAQKQ